jgi:opacity protein-like surface antigen
MTIFKALALAAAAFLAAVLFGALPASAQAKAKAPPTARNWTSCYGGVHGGGSIATTELGIGGASIDSLASRGMVGGIHAGCDWHFIGTPLVIGATGSYDWSNVEFAIDPGLLSAKIEKTWSVGGRIGAVVAGTLLYIPGGYAKSDFEWNAGVPAPDLKGWYVGGGWELPLSETVTVGAEYRYTHYDRVTVGGFVNLDTDQHSLVARITVHTPDLFGFAK